jgi:predicted phage gp36 major capsid-like protein
MNGDNIEKLEEVVAIAIKELKWLRSQNDALREDLSRRMTDLENLSTDEEQIKKQTARIAELEKENKRLASGQSKVRKKVGNILSELEKADFM